MVTFKWRFVGGWNRHENHSLYPILPLGVIIKKSCPTTLDKYDHQCGFIDYIDRINKACKQRNQSVYMLFWFLRAFFQSFFISNATNPPFTLGLRVKGDKRARLTSFQKKGGEKNETIFFSDHNRKSV